MTVQGKKFPYTGKGKTRPIPQVIDESDRRAVRKMAATTVPKTKATQNAFGPRPSAPAVFGKPAGGAKTPAGGTFNPTDTGSLMGSD
jgi:hypothetical protein